MQIPVNTNTSIWDLFIATPRASMFDTFIMVGLLTSIALFAFAKWYKSEIFSFLRGLFFNGRSMSLSIEENIKLNHIGDYILLVNFWLLSMLGGILVLKNPIYHSFSEKLPVWLVFTWPILFYFWQYLSLSFVSLATGLKEIKQENKVNLVLFPQLMSVLLFLLVLVWQLNQNLSNYLCIIFFVLMLVLVLYLVFKGIVFSVQKAMPYYYIILYICTLEILPFIYIMYGLIGKR